MKKIIYSQLRFGLLICLLLVTNIAMASLHKNIWPKWASHNPQSQAVISHQEWQEFLTQCVITNEEGINLVDYPHLTEANLVTLNHYITRMSKIHINDYNRNEQLAFWLNLYNALTVQIVADYYPVASIQEINISPGLFSVGPWGANLVAIAGTQLTLDDIQNRIIRPIWNDPRAIYAINHATIGGANLSKEVFQGNIIDTQLNKVTYEYVNSLRGIQIIEGKLVASKIYHWFIDDFGGNTQDLMVHLSQYAKEPLRSQLLKSNTVDSSTYNWHLNSTNASTS